MGHPIANWANQQQQLLERQQLPEHCWLVSAFVDDIVVNQIPKENVKLTLYLEIKTLEKLKVEIHKP